jgi:hypothetical protein
VKVRAIKKENKMKESKTKDIKGMKIKKLTVKETENIIGGIGLFLVKVTPIHCGCLIILDN